MTDAELLTCTKQDLQLMTYANDTLITNLIAMAKKAIATEGIVLTPGNIEHDMLIVQYAAYLFRGRAAENTEMPRFLRWQMNNVLFTQKGAADNDV